MSFTNRTHKILHALDILHARTLAQVCEVLTGMPFKQSLRRVRTGVNQDGLFLWGEVHIKHNEHFHPRPPGWASLPCTYKLEYKVLFQQRKATCNAMPYWHQRLACTIQLTR